MPLPLAPLRLFTLGHGTLEENQFVAVLGESGVTSVVDVRRFPGSRRCPRFGRDAMEAWLPGHRIAYRWEARLGGYRKAAAASPNTGLRHPSFRAYADHMASAEFLSALGDLMAEAARRPVAVMCSETLWWRCHRRLIADAAVMVHGATAEHLFPGRPPAPHTLTDTAATDGTGRVLYRQQDPLPLQLVEPVERPPNRLGRP